MPYVRDFQIGPIPYYLYTLDQLLLKEEKIPKQFLTDLRQARIEYRQTEFYHP